MKSNDFLSEGIVEDAHEMHQDHEVQMAREECYHAAEDAIVLHKLFKHVSEQQGLEGWVSAKVTLAADYLKTVREYLEYQLMTAQSAQANPIAPVAEGVITADDFKTITEVDPHNFDSDEDYYDAVRSQGRPRMSGGDMLDEIARLKNQLRYATTSSQRQYLENEIDELENIYYGDDELSEGLTYTQKHSSWSVQSPKKNEFNTRYKLDQEKEARAHAERIGGKLVKVDQHGHSIKAKKSVSEGLQPDSDLAVIGAKILNALKEKCQEIDQDYPEMWKTFTSDDWIQSGAALDFVEDYITVDHQTLNTFFDAWEELDGDPFQYWPAFWRDGQWDDFIAPWKQYSYEVLKSRGVDPKPPGTVHEGLGDVVKGVKRYVKGKPSKSERETHHANRTIGAAQAFHQTSDPTEKDYIKQQMFKNANRYYKVKNLPKKGVAEGSDDKEPFDYAKWKASNVKPRKPRGYKDAEAIGQQQREIDKERKERKEQGVAETRVGNRMSDIEIGSPKVVYYKGKAVGEVGIDHEASPGNGPYYMKHYLTGKDMVGYATKKEALADLKHMVMQQVSENAGSIATVVNPTPKNKAKVGTLFGGTYKQKKAK